MSENAFIAAREAALTRLRALVEEDTRIVALWLQGSLADGSADPLSDIDAYIAVADEHFDAVYAARQDVLRAIAPPLAWSNATTPGLTAVHALLEGPVKLDLFFERASRISAAKRPAAKVLVDKTGATAALDFSYEPPRALVRLVLDMMIRMQRQGALWPLRLLMRGQFATFAMMELDLVNRELALLMALQVDASLYHANPFSLARHLPRSHQEELETLTTDALAALSSKDLAAAKAVHLRVFDALVREGRAACAIYEIDYPIGVGADAKLRDLLAQHWPA